MIKKIFATVTLSAIASYAAIYLLASRFTTTPAMEFFAKFIVDKWIDFAWFVGLFLFLWLFWMAVDRVILKL